MIRASDETLQASRLSPPYSPYLKSLISHYGVDIKLFVPHLLFELSSNYDKFEILFGFMEQLMLFALVLRGKGTRGVLN